jgi:formylglycine-generating enzyme required for sulfatase activity
MAANYCAWQDKRLPSASEWQAAASVSPTTGQPFRYPWGESFDPQRTNGADSHFGDTVVAGSFRPAGDSPSGAADMAGNVAEWTATLVLESEELVDEQNSAEARALAIVKGGSFASAADDLTVSAEMHISMTSASPEVGFRCARTYLRKES